MSTLTNKQNLLNVLKGGKAERTPWVPFVGVHAGKILGLNAEEILQSTELMAKSVVTAARKYKAHGMPICFDLQIEAEMLGCQLKWAEKTPPSVTSHPLDEGKCLADLPAYNPNSGRLQKVLDAIPTIKKEIGDDCVLYGLITGPFTLALHLRGSEIFLDIADEEESVDELMAYCRDIQLQTAKAYLEAGVDVIAVVDPMCSQISPSCFATYVAPYINPIFDFVRQEGKLSSMFVCGNATAILDELCRCSCDNISIDENVDLSKLRDKALAAGKSFGGNIQLTVVILLGDELDCKKNAIECMDVGGLQSFVLAPGCDLPFDSPIENMLAITEIVHDDYARDIARAVSKEAEAEDDSDISYPDYTQEKVVDVVTLDSGACPPCFYMVQAAQVAAAELDPAIKVVERKITTREGLAYMKKLGVQNIPTICIQGKPVFASIIPDKLVLMDAMKGGMEGI